jgi:hypothetical protein
MPERNDPDASIHCRTRSLLKSCGEEDTEALLDFVGGGAVRVGCPEQQGAIDGRPQDTVELRQLAAVARRELTGLDSV